ncbi:MAG: hypothetical protein KDI64_19015, partial [Candidatus Accumulibacter sp.]|nr:hypothetical protein [Accumulibacter sp.]
TALGQLNLIGFAAKGDAGSLLEMALDTCKEVRVTSRTAAKMYPAIEQALGRLRAEAEAKKKRKIDDAGK